jgi:hypothetical protein
MGLPRGLLGRRCAWVLVFRDAQVKRALLRDADQPFATVSYF